MYKSRFRAYLYVLRKGWLFSKTTRIYEIVEYANNPGVVYDRDREVEW